MNDTAYYASYHPVLDLIIAVRNVELKSVEYNADKNAITVAVKFQSLYTPIDVPVVIDLGTGIMTSSLFVTAFIRGQNRVFPRQRVIDIYHNIAVFSLVCAIDHCFKQGIDLPATFLSSKTTAILLSYVLDPDPIMYRNKQDLYALESTHEKLSYKDADLFKYIHVPFTNDYVVVIPEKMLYKPLAGSSAVLYQLCNSIKSASFAIDRSTRSVNISIMTQGIITNNSDEKVDAKKINVYTFQGSLDLVTGELVLNIDQSIFRKASQVARYRSVMSVSHEFYEFAYILYGLLAEVCPEESLPLLTKPPFSALPTVSSLLKDSIVSNLLKKVHKSPSRSPRTSPRELSTSQTAAIDKSLGLGSEGFTDIVTLGLGFKPVAPDIASPAKTAPRRTAHRAPAPALASSSATTPLPPTITLPQPPSGPRLEGTAFTRRARRVKNPPPQSPLPQTADARSIRFLEDLSRQQPPPVETKLYGPNRRIVVRLDGGAKKKDYKPTNKKCWCMYNNRKVKRVVYDKGGVLYVKLGGTMRLLDDVRSM